MDVVHRSRASTTSSTPLLTTRQRGRRAQASARQRQSGRRRPLGPGSGCAGRRRLHGSGLSGPQRWRPSGSCRAGVPAQQRPPGAGGPSRRWGAAGRRKSRKVKGQLISNQCMDTGKEQGCGQAAQASKQDEARPGQALAPRRAGAGGHTLQYCNQYRFQSCNVLYIL